MMTLSSVFHCLGGYLFFNCVPVANTDVLSLILLPQYFINLATKYYERDIQVWFQESFCLGKMSVNRANLYSQCFS